MCGISGIIYFEDSSKRVDPVLINRMNELLSHRGPDSQGVYTDKKIGLGHTRLSILDLTANGAQPMLSHDERYVLVMNGEIYNHQTLRKELMELGYHFKGHSDTETVVNAYAQWGNEVFRKLNGIFALAIYDKKKKICVLARDRFGVKPLYWAKINGGICFASEIKAILKVQAFKTIDSRGLHEFLYYGYPMRERTLFKGIYKVLQGRYIEIHSKGEIEIHPFWSPENLMQLPEIHDENTAIKTTKSLLESAVTRQLQSDVPVGVFLSGGIDSSAITAFATKHYRGKINTYSAGFDFDDGHNELPMAAKLAKKYGTTHHELRIKGGDLKEVINKLVWYHDAPFSDAANIPLYLLTRALNGTLKVILQGDGGDEMFGGYPRYHLTMKYRRYSVMLKILHAVKWGIPYAKMKKRIERFYPVFTEQEDGRYFARLLTLETPENSPLQSFSDVSRAKLQSYNPFDYFEQLSDQFAFLSTRSQKLLWLDTQIILPDQFLEKVDKSTMANAIEVRVPFLDNELSAFAMRLPAGIKLKGGVKKYILKKALEGIVPDKVLYGPKKGFGVPYENWLRGPLFDFMAGQFNSHFNTFPGFLNESYVLELMRRHQSGKENHGFILWKLLNLCIWMERYEMEDLG